MIAAGIMILIIVWMFTHSASKKVKERNEEAKRKNEQSEAKGQPYKPEIERNPVIDGFLLVLVAMGFAFIATLALSSVLPLLPD